MTERGSSSMKRSAHEFIVGPSRMAWSNDALVIDIDETCVPVPRKLRGRVTLTPSLLYDAPVQLDEAGRHFWRAVAPLSRVEVDFESPRQKWSGQAYHDMNWGDEPLEKGFTGWTWSRSADADATLVYYDAERKDGSRKSAALSFADGEVSAINPPPQHALRRGFWTMPRVVRAASKPRLVATLEDAPFYTRNHVRIGDRDAIHESLSLTRFDTRLVQLMLPFRMPRKA
jgi:carotenoid 1,2-hydratase